MLVMTSMDDDTAMLLARPADFADDMPNVLPSLQEREAMRRHLHRVREDVSPAIGLGVLLIRSGAQRSA